MATLKDTSLPQNSLIWLLHSLEKMNLKVLKIIFKSSTVFKVVPEDSFKRRQSGRQELKAVDTLQVSK